jgi:hypothetical protein
MNIPNNFASVHALASFQSSQADNASSVQSTFRSLMKQFQSKPLKLSASQLHSPSRGSSDVRSISQQVLQDTAGVLR